MNPMRMILATLAGVMLASHLLGYGMARVVDENRSQQCKMGIITYCD